jgi:hypothetical protein
MVGKLRKGKWKKMFSSLSKYLAVLCSGTGIEHQPAVLRNEEFIENIIN